MSELNQDIILLIAKELQDDGKSLYSCLLVNRTWCETTVPILWKNPGRYLEADHSSYLSLFNVILSHLSEESRDIFKNQGIMSEAYQQPSFNYISFWKCLDLKLLDDMMIIKDIQESIIRDEIFKMFISENVRFTHLCVHYHIDKINFILERLARICKSIKKLELYINDNKYELRAVAKLIEAQENLNDVMIMINIRTITPASCKILEESLIKHADTVQYLKINWYPVTKILSYLVNLLSFDIDVSPFEPPRNVSISLPVIKILRTRAVSSKFLTSLIKNTKGHLTEIDIDIISTNEFGKMIYEYCPNLKYLRLSVSENNILDLKDLLINCQHLNGLYIIPEIYNDDYFDNLFEILAKFSPTSLYKFKFFLNFLSSFSLKSLKSFFDNWKNRRPMLLQILGDFVEKYADLVEEYKAKGTVKKYDDGNLFEYFEWVNYQ